MSSGIKPKARKVFPQPAKCDREDVVIFLMRSLTPQQATGNALAVAVHTNSERIAKPSMISSVGETSALLPVMILIAVQLRKPQTMP